MTSEPPGKAYTAPDITVYFDAKRCRHFAECVRGLPQVFDVAARPWIQPANAESDGVAEVVRRCPSGALHYRLDRGPGEDEGSTTSVEPLPEGPILLRGTLRLRSSQDPEVWTDETRMAACGCGRTSNTPFCDGTCVS